MIYLKYCIVLLLLTKTTTSKKLYGMEGFVINGEQAKIVDFPHSVFLFMKCETDWICGGAILNQNIVLTAGHCLYGCDLPKYKIDAYAGHEDLHKTRTIVEIDKVLVHEGYSSELLFDDIALGRLKEGLPLGKYIKRVIIKNTMPLEPKSAVIAGWGMVSDELSSDGVTRGTVVMMTTKQGMISMEACEDVIGDLTDGVLCAGSLDRTAPRPAAGDSGSALVTPDKHQQLGLVSFRIDAVPTLLIYTNVTHYYSWIQEKSMLLFCDGNWEK